MNEELILLYCDIGEYISRESKSAEYGGAFVERLAELLTQAQLFELYQTRNPTLMSIFLKRKN